MIKSIPIEENPREKVKQQGIESLSNAELIALLIHTGTKDESVIALSNRLLNEIGGFNQLQFIDLSKLLSVKGIGEAKAITLLSIVELSKRLKSKSMTFQKIKEPEHVYHYVKDELMMLSQENFVVLCLDSRFRIIKKKTVFVGSINISIVKPREVFKEALSVNSVYIILIHNHPSGDPRPSDEDIELTYHFMDLGEMMGIKVIDHIIIGWHAYFSIGLNKLFSKDSI